MATSNDVVIHHMNDNIRIMAEGADEAAAVAALSDLVNSNFDGTE